MKKTNEKNFTRLEEGKEKKIRMRNRDRCKCKENLEGKWRTLT